MPSWILILLTACALPVTQPTTAPPTLEPDAAPAPAHQRLVVIAGQSNAVGTAAVPQLTARTELAEPYPAVTFRQWWHTGPHDDPVTWNIVAPEPLQPRDDAGKRKFAVELSLFRDLEAARPGQWTGMKFAIGTTTLVRHWAPAGPYPADENLFHQLVDAIAQTELEADAKLDTLVWIQGTTDATGQPAADDYGANLTAFIAELRARFGPARVVFDRLSVQVALPYQDAVRAGQAKVAAEVADVVMVDADDIDMTYPPHYSADGYVELGDRLAQAILQ